MCNASNSHGCYMFSTIKQPADGTKLTYQQPPSSGVEFLIFQFFESRVKSCPCLHFPRTRKTLPSAPFRHRSSSTSSSQPTAFCKYRFARWDVLRQGKRKESRAIEIQRTYHRCWLPVFLFSHPFHHTPSILFTSFKTHSRVARTISTDCD